MVADFSFLFCLLAKIKILAVIRSVTKLACFFYWTCGSVILKGKASLSYPSLLCFHRRFMAARIFMRCYFLVKGVLHLLKKKTEQIKPLAQLFANTHTMF